MPEQSRWIVTLSSNSDQSVEAEFARLDNGTLIFGNTNPREEDGSSTAPTLIYAFAAGTWVEVYNVDQPVKKPQRPEMIQPEPEIYTDPGDDNPYPELEEDTPRPEPLRRKLIDIASVARVQRTDIHRPRYSISDIQAWLRETSGRNS